MTQNERLQKLAEQVHAHLHEMALKYPTPQHDPVYRWEHTLRVAQYGKAVAQAEGADVETVIAACLLHDIAHFECDDDYKSHGRRGAALSRPILESLGYPAQQIDDICYAVAVHVDGDAGYEHPVTLESSCVSDADNLERFGAIRILHWTVEEMNDLPLLTEKLSKRIPRLEGYLQNSPLETERGRALMAGHLELQIAMFKALVKEGQTAQVPLLDEPL